ncbi:MAG TPA: hypothetical protein ENK57_01025, partial [Polyangiaceae bacterium]|nr:hypothetical protein [Polyangiaceae bacterium]
MNLLERLTVLGVVVMMVVPSLTRAQDLPSRVTRRAVRAAVKITVQAEGGSPGRPRSSTGSGSIIDARGYILT